MLMCMQIPTCPGETKKKTHTQSTLLLTTCDGAMAHVLLSIFIAEREDGRAQHGDAKGLEHLGVVVPNQRVQNRRVYPLQTSETPGQNNPAQCRSEAIALTFSITSHDPYTLVSSFPVDYTCTCKKKKKKKKRGSGCSSHPVSIPSLSFSHLSPPSAVSPSLSAYILLPPKNSLSARRCDSGARVIAGSLLNSHNALL